MPPLSTRPSGSTSRSLICVQLSYLMMIRRSDHTASATALRNSGRGPVENQPLGSRWKREDIRVALALPIGRQGGEQLQLGRRDLVAKPEIPRRTGQARQEQSPRLGRRQPGQPGPPAVEEGKAAIAAPISA